MIDEMEGGQVFFDPNCYSPTDCIAAVVGGVGNSRSSKTSFLVVVLSFLIFLFCCCPSIASISLVCVCARRVQRFVCFRWGFYLFVSLAAAQSLFRLGVSSRPSVSFHSAISTAKHSKAQRRRMKSIQEKK